MKRNYLIFIIFLLLFFLIGCRQVRQSQELHISAAASLTKVMEEMAQAFNRRKPEVQIYLNFAGSQILRRQIEQGIDTDLFFSANEVQMKVLQDNELVSGVKKFALNKMMIVVFKDKSLQVNSISDLGQPGLSLALGTSEVPAGRYARQVIERLPETEQKSILNNITTLEYSVRGVLAKVINGEIDAGFVFATDVKEPQKSELKLVNIPKNLNVTAEYYLGQVAGSKNRSMSEQFIEFVLSSEGQNILEYLMGYINTFGVPALLVSHNNEDGLLTDNIFTIKDFKVVKEHKGGKECAKRGSTRHNHRRYHLA
ncbi:MAG: molybdate transport system substrate-binding protein [Clostridia bacterium]|nr:molybdate transport system substrate-binding protein [Clostridia bacterium]